MCLPHNPASHRVPNTPIQSVTPSVTHSSLTQPVSWNVSNPSHYPPLLLVRLSTTHLFSHPPYQPHCQSSIPLINHPVGCTVGHIAWSMHLAGCSVSHPSLYSPTVSAELSTTHIHSVGCTINDPSPESPILLTAPMVKYCLCPYRVRLNCWPLPVGCTISHLSLYSSAVSAALSATHLFTH